eukprot:1191764-Prorocentrum_minimum.AAC.1
MTGQSGAPEEKTKWRTDHTTWKIPIATNGTYKSKTHLKGAELTALILWAVQTTSEDKDLQLFTDCLTSS